MNFPYVQDYCMIDWETVGTRSWSGILTMGAIKFDKYGDIKSYFEGGKPASLEDLMSKVDCFYRRIDFQSLVDAGLFIDQETLTWWGKQKEEARKEAFNPENRVPIGEAFDDFYLWFGSTKTVLSHGPDFDGKMYEDISSILGKKAPWKFWEKRCTRTHYENADVDMKFYRSGHHHHALWDCFDQIVAAQVAAKTLAQWKADHEWTNQVRAQQAAAQGKVAV